jgi:hypothetical protein
MESPLAYQAAIHNATTVQEIGAILKRFFASLAPSDRDALPPEISSISTFSEKGLLRKTHLVRAVAPAHVGPAAERLLASAALKVSVLQMDSVREQRARWGRQRR